MATRGNNFPENAQEVEDFYGVYLLFCTNPKYRGRTYIGFTVDPNRRISQHNKGSQAGGARRTSNRGPWDMVLITHGFPNEISALRFEWAWQHPGRSRRLQGLPGKRAKETSFTYCLRLLASMLNTGPWHKLPLTLRWLKPEYQAELPIQPPLHMPIVFGPVRSKKIKGGGTEKEEEAKQGACSVCGSVLGGGRQAVVCLYPRCRAAAHSTCLAELFTASTGELLPVRGNCPVCTGDLLWGDLIRKQRGCYQELSEEEWSDDVDD